MQAVFQWAVTAHCAQSLCHYARLSANVRSRFYSWHSRRYIFSTASWSASSSVNTGRSFYGVRVTGAYDQTASYSCRVKNLWSSASAAPYVSFERCSLGILSSFLVHQKWQWRCRAMSTHRYCSLHHHVVYNRVVTCTVITETPLLTLTAVTTVSMFVISGHRHEHRNLLSLHNDSFVPRT